MDLLKAQDLRALIDHPTSPCVSIYIPTHRSGSEEDRIRLRNALVEAEELLDEMGHRRLKSKGFFDGAKGLLSDGGFWRGQSEGLALFLAPDFFRYFRLPLNFHPMVTAAGHFHLKPLIPILSGDGRFFILAISQNAIRLLDCTRDSVAQVDLPPEMPRSLDLALMVEDLQSSLQVHTPAPSFGAQGRDRAGIFHGHGSASDKRVAKKRIAEYFQIVDRNLAKVLNGKRAPMILAAVDFLHPIYQSVTSYGRLMEPGIEGNPDRSSAQQLHRQAWEILRPSFERDRQTAMDRLDVLSDTNRVSRDIRQILPAALAGQVDVLLVAEKQHVWGRYDRELNELEIHDERESGDQDLLDLVAVSAWLHKGAVYMVGMEHVPGGGQAAAAFRPAGAIIAAHAPAQKAG